MPVFFVQGYWQVPLTQRAHEISAFCNTKRFISVQGHAEWTEKFSSNIPKNG